jgi:hypothetical protein
MGRPINKKFFGNLNRPYQNQAVGGPTGDGGEGITISVSNSGTVYSQGISFTVGTPNIAGGIQATVNSSVNSAGNVTLTVNDPGTGYTSAPTISLVKPSSTTTSVSGNYTATTMTATSVTGIYLGMTIAGGSTGNNGRVQTITGPVAGVYTITSNVLNDGTFTNQTLTFSDNGASFAKTVGLTNSVQNAIAFTSYLTTGSSAVRGGDIMKQEASRRYLVNNSQGRGRCKLVATDVLTAGTMNIIATDFGGSTYFVTKLTGRRATLQSRTGTSTALVTLTLDPLSGISTGATGWTLGSSTGTIVTISSN